MATRIGKRIRPDFEKARNSALLAVEVYNKPAVTFKSAGYIVLMVIAWTALFHAIFRKRRVTPCYKEKNGRYRKEDGDYKHWELKTCLNKYFGSDSGNPVRNNLNFFIGLRNQIEHRFFPPLDDAIFGESQAMLLNFDEMLAKEFGEKWRLRESLSFSLQFFPSGQSFAAAVKRSPKDRGLKEFIDNFRNMLEPSVLGDSQYAFRAFLIQVANHDSQDALAVQFVHWDKLTPEQQVEISRCVSLIKTIPVDVANAGKFKPGEVVAQVQAALGNRQIDRRSKAVDKFTIDTHTRCWRRYGVRPPSGAPDPKVTKADFCTYDELHGDYGYTQAWIEFLKEKMADQAEYDALYAK